MFPVIDVSGNIIAFGGRVMDDSVPKYKNTTDTPVFKKSRNLFALNFAHRNCQERLILCEGYMDVIALHAAGITNTVAALGTSITSEQARLIRRYTQNVIICTDSDAAGQKAADRAIKLFEEAGLNVKVLKLEGAKDPDEFIQKYGVEKFRSFLDGSRTKFDFTFDKVLLRYDISNPQQKIEAAMAIADEISKFYSSAERDIYIREAAKRFEIKVESLAQDVERRMRKRNSEALRRQTEQNRLDLSGLSDKVNRDAAKHPAAARAEEAVLGMLQIYPEHRALFLTESPPLQEADFTTELGKRCFSFIINAERNGGFDPVLLDSEFSSDEVGRFTKMRVTRMGLGDNGKDVFLECAAKLRSLTQEGNGLSEKGTVDDLESLLHAYRNKQDT
jgi:DNA primase